MKEIKRFFEIDNENKWFVFPTKYYEELFSEEDNEVRKQLRAVMALGFYDGYVPVEKKRKKSENRNTSVHRVKEKGIVEWLEKHNPDWKKKWDISGTVRQADGTKFPFMVRKSYFLKENPDAREYCGVKETNTTPDKNENENENRLPAKWKILQREVEKTIANNNNSKKEEP